MFVGRRNQKIPTPKVKSGGKIKVRSVGLIPKPSQREKVKRIKVSKVRAVILRKRYWSPTKFMPTKPRQRIIDVATNFSLLDKVSVGKNLLNVIMTFNFI